MQVGSFKLRIPSEHQLPAFHSKYPYYDRYFLQFFSDLREDFSQAWFIDVGANVGDTTLAVLSKIPEMRFLALEGSPYFLNYLRHNVEKFPNVEVIPSFVCLENFNYIYSNSNTGSGSLAPTQDAQKKGVVENTISVSALLEKTNGEIIIWKSDLDGLDIPLIAKHFDEILEKCSVVWFEFDPLGAAVKPGDVELLVKKISAVDRHVVIFDNLGRLIAEVHSSIAGELILSLSEWIVLQERSGTQSVHYLDIWLAPENLAKLLKNTSSALPPL